jgi:hypothetical protein
MGRPRAEAEDLPDAANGAIRASGWLLQVSIKHQRGRALIARRKDKPAAWEPDTRYSFADSPPSQPATTIPDLTPS